MGTEGSERTATGICPGCGERKGVLRDGKMAVHKVDSTLVKGTRVRCSGAHQAPKEVCTRRNQGTDQIGAACPLCDHSNLLHPGNSNRGISQCQLCMVQFEVKMLRAERAS